MAEVAESFGRVDPDGSVHVLDNGTWRSVGSFPDGSPEEAIGYFQKKFDDLAALVVLAEQRLKASAPVKDLRAQAEKLQADLVEPSAVGDLESLRARVGQILEALPALEERQKAQTDEALQEAKAYRESLVSEIEALAAREPSTIRWKQATETISSLFEKWQQHQQTGPRLPKKEADELWTRFRKAKTALEKARRAYFATLDEKSKEAKAIKRELIDKAEALAAKGAAGIPAYRTLLESWKAAPRAARSVEDGLWKKFKAAGDALYQAKAEADRADDEANAGNLEAKQALIEEFSDILTMTDHQAATERLRAFHQKFQSIGPVPRKSVRAIDDKAKKLDAHVRSLEQEHWRANDPEKKARSQSMADQLRQAIEDLEAKIQRSDGKEKASLEAELDTKRQWLSVVDS